MALLNKLFFPSATSVASASSLSSSSSTWAPTHIETTGLNLNKNHNKNSSVHSKNYLNQLPFDGRQVRMLLYRESDRKGRRLLFDSNALQKVLLKEATTECSKKGEKTSRHGLEETNEKESSNNLKQQPERVQFSSDFIEVCNEYGYKHNRPNSADITSIGEMVFGALAMSFRGTALKVHWLRAPPRVLCSQVFFTPVSPTYNHSPYSTITYNALATPRTSISSEQGSIDGLSMSSFNVPFSVSVDRHMSLTQSDRSSMTCPLDVPDQLSIYPSPDIGARYSSPYSTATDSGYSTSRGHELSDQWSASYQYSTRSSLGSVISENLDSMNKFYTESAYFTEGSSAFLDGVASDGCLQRRVFRNLRTSFENDHSMNDFIGFASDAFPVSSGGAGGGGGSEGGYMGVPNYRRASYCANESRSNPEIGKRRDGVLMKPVTRRAKLGLAVCITMSESFEDEMELFCSEHIALLESMLSRLRARTEQAYLNHKDFLQILYQAWQETQQWFMDLFTAPRINCPVWLSITTSGSKYSKNVAERFMKELCWLLSFADTKDTNFFISTMLTAVLTHHLGWVSTVSAFCCASSSHAEAATAAIEQREKLLQISQKHPYNALWAQMGDLFGAVGVPPRLARTVVYGTEKLSVERLLNVLTYFIRCGEVRRSAKREHYDKELITCLADRNENSALKNHMKTTMSMPITAGLKDRPNGARIGAGGLVRNQTCKQNLSGVAKNYMYHSDDTGLNMRSRSDFDLVPTLKRNEIPNVFAFRDSHFVQQELRIGNYLMDTGIEKNSIQAQVTSETGRNDARIRLTLTTPDNIVLSVEDESTNNRGDDSTVYVGDGVLEAIEIDTSETTNSKRHTTPAETAADKKFLWSMTSPSVKEGVSLNDSYTQQLKNNVSTAVNRAVDSRKPISALEHLRIKRLDEVMAQERLEKRTSHLSLSDLITQNSIGKSERMTWGIEPIKENLSLEEQIHFDNCQKVIEREHGISNVASNITINASANANINANVNVNASNTTEASNAVVFVLGDNEPLVNIKKSNEDLSVRDTQKPLMYKSLCAFHQGSCGKLADFRKHSGVKFNFEQYPQIVTNYMKRKNLVLSNYDLLMDKCSKLETDSQEAVLDNVSKLPTSVPAASSAVQQQSTAAECVICNSCLDLCQTPSNATELEFEADHEHYYVAPMASSACSMQKVSSTASVDTLKSPLSTNDLVALKTSPPLETAVPTTHDTVNYCDNEVPSAPNVTNAPPSSATKATKYAQREEEHLLKLPMPGIREVVPENVPPDDMKLRAGFIPSLFLGVSDHYISDMVLQGTFAPPNIWEHSLRESLTMAAHSASLVSLPAENLGIIANMEKWNVRLISSQQQRFANDDVVNAPVGMSQLVSSMLETVHAMHNSGISAYECLSFLESKLQEIYLQSETLAAFLLETDFCPLSTVTTAFSLSENDIPLLLSIASIHTPQISNKCGVSFM